MTFYADFGPVVASVDVDAAVIATLRKWFPTYLQQLELERGKASPFYARPRSYASVIGETQFLDQTLPAVVATTARVDGTPQITADGTYVAAWLVAISVVVRGRRGLEAKSLGSLYELTARRIVVQQSSLGGFSKDTRWIGGGEVRPLPDQTKDNRYLAEGASQFLVFVDGNVREGTGPVEPDQAAYHALAEVESVGQSVIGSSPGGS